MGLSNKSSSSVGAPSLMVMLLFWSDDTVLSFRELGGLIGRGVGGRRLGGLTGGGLRRLGFMDWTYCWLCVMWPFMVSSESGKYLDVLV